MGDSEMKTENPDKKYSFWEFSKCKKEHKIKTLFCDGCGAQIIKGE